MRFAGGSELAKKLIDVYLTLFSLIMTGKVNCHSLCCAFAGPPYNCAGVVHWSYLRNHAGLVISF
jgi:hypothetical protein